MRTEIRFQPRAGRNRIGVACGAGREVLRGVSPGPDHRTRTAHTGMAARWSAPVAHAHAAWGAGVTRVWFGWPHRAAWGGPMGAQLSPDGRRVRPWPVMPARWCTGVHATPVTEWHGGEGERRRGRGHPELEYQLPNLGSFRGSLGYDKRAVRSEAGYHPWRVEACCSQNSPKSRFLNINSTPQNTAEGSAGYLPKK